MITESGVCKLLTDLKEHKASGLDGVPARVLKHRADSVTPVLQKIFQASIDTLQTGILDIYTPQSARTYHILPHLYAH